MAPAHVADIHDHPFAPALAPPFRAGGDEGRGGGPWAKTSSGDADSLTDS
jgi:hypothetical protein